MTRMFNPRPDHSPIARVSAAVFFMVVILCSAVNAADGRITGKAVDAQSGEALVGVTVMLENTKIGAKCNLDGEYTIKKAPPGTYTLIASRIGYISTRIADVTLEKGEVVRLDIVLAQEVVKSDRVVTVKAERIQGSDAALHMERRNSIAVSDAVSASTISRAGSSNAADAMNHVTGASVVGGKYVYIRGLGERYSNTTLNGSILPSADPDKFAFNMDLVPAQLLDKVVVTKTFTPDQAGNFTGGSVDIGTKSIPDKMVLSFSQSMGYNAQVNGNSNFLSYRGGETDWLAIRDDSYDIPAPMTDPQVDIPEIGQATQNPELAHRLDYLSRSFSNVMAPKRATPPTNQSYDFTFGNRYLLFDQPVGVVTSLTYSRKASFYDNGSERRWKLTGTGDKTDCLNNEINLRDTRGIDAVHWGGMANLTMAPHLNHNVSATYMYSRDGESEARYLVGSVPRDLNQKDVFQTRVLKYTERTLGSAQVNGEHLAGQGFPLRVSWRYSYAENSIVEPDIRFFSNHYQRVVRYNPDGTVRLDTTIYKLSPSVYVEPTRHFRDVDERNRNVKLDLALPFKSWSNQQSKASIGFDYTRTNRERRERTFLYKQTTNQAEYLGDPERFFGDDVGLMDSVQYGSSWRYVFGNYIIDATDPSSNYDGWQDIVAFYGMLELPLTRRLRFIGGARLEKTDMYLKTHDIKDNPGILDNDDWLPSASFIYKLTENSNLRTAYSRTLARPSLREKAPYITFEYNNDYLFYGNENLERTLINNFDVRWESFPRPGEIFAVSGFYKRFRNPIERVIINGNGHVKYLNVNEARVYGAEFEVRTSLGRLWSALESLRIGGNLALIYSQVNIAENEMIKLRGYFGDDVSDKRPLSGQSPYLINADLSYDSRRGGTSITALYNVFGERLSEVSMAGTPDVYEQPRHMVDLTLSQRILGGLRLKAAVKDMLNAWVRKTQEYKGIEYVQSEYRPGRVISIGTSYSF